MKKRLPLILAGLMAAWFLSTLRTPAPKSFARPEFAAGYEAFGRLPLVFGGRVQPMDSLARNSLLQLREKQTINLEPWKDWTESPRIIPAIEWLATVLMNPEEADQWPVFRIDHPEVIGLLKLPQKDRATQRDGKHYSWNDIQPAIDVMESETKRIGGSDGNKGIEAGLRTPFERAVMKMHERLVLYMRLKNTLQPQDAQDWPKELAEFQGMIPAGVAAARAQQAGEKYDETVFRKFLGDVQRFDLMSRFEPPLLIPPPSQDHARESWARIGEALLEAPHSATALSPVVAQYAAMAGAFKRGDADGFLKTVADYRSSLTPQFDPELTKAGREGFFNRLQPFYNAMVFYVLAFLLACGSWFNLSDGLRRSAVWLIGLAFVIHTTGLLFRMVLEGRPPVTNLYSSAIFIGWGAVILGLVLERFYRDGIGAVVAASMGFITLIIAHNLSLGGDTMEMMRAVLDTNFWLATHVVIVTLGYASTFVAGFLAILYIVLGVFTPRLTQPLATVAATASSGAKSAKNGGPARGGETAARALTRMVYGIVCFATLFSFVGTVLGGIWADQSWGRFWGWDPKENGALIIVLWNALILHLRWGGMIRERGLINCALVGNIVTSWSWFGVNMLGIGLHSYGFMDAAFKWLMLFISSQLLLIMLGLLPSRFWVSFKNSTLPKPSNPPRDPKPVPQGA